jgi:hypothetical protein
LVDEVEVSENKEALIVLAGTVAAAATPFVASLPIRWRPLLVGHRLIINICLLMTQSTKMSLTVKQQS